MDRSERRGENEALFRQVNEQIDELTGQAWTDEQRNWEYMCECARLTCTARVPMTSGDYEAVRLNPLHFVVAPEHYDPAIETLVEQTPSYWLVEKRGEAAEVAEETDPRS